MVAPLYRPLRGALGPPPGLRRSSSLLCLGRASALLSWAVLPPCGPRGPCPFGPPPSSALGSVVVCRSSALWASRGGVVGFAPLGAAGPSGPSPPSVFCRRRPPGLLSGLRCGLCLCAVRCACRWVVPHGGPPWAARAALAGGNPIQRVLSVGAHSERGRFAQGTLFPRLGAGSVRLQLRYRKGNRLPQIGQYHQYSLTGYPQKGQRGPSGACTMTISFQSDLLDIYH